MSKKSDAVGADATVQAAADGDAGASLIILRDGTKAAVELCEILQSIATSIEEPLASEEEIAEASAKFCSKLTSSANPLHQAITAPGVCQALIDVADARRKGRPVAACGEQAPRFHRLCYKIGRTVSKKLSSARDWVAIRSIQKVLDCDELEYVKEGVLDDAAKAIKIIVSTGDPPSNERPTALESTKANNEPAEETAEREGAAATAGEGVVPDGAPESHLREPSGAGESDGEQRKPINYVRWAMGRDCKKWWLFHWFPNKKLWAQRGQVEIPAGNPGKLAYEFAKQGGHLSRAESVDLFKTDRSLPDKTVFDSTVVKAKQHLVKAIREAISRVAKADDQGALPINYDQRSSAWKCELQIGFAIKDIEDGKLKFKTRDRLTEDDRIDLQLP